MKLTRALVFGLALVCSSVGSGLAQISINVVGYVNVPLTNGFTFLTNPLSATNNSLNFVLTPPPTGTRVYLWDVGNQTFSPPSTYSPSGGWSINYDVPVGLGFVVYSPAKWTNTFVGEVLQGTLTTLVTGSNKLSLLGSKVPQSGQITTDLAFPGIDGSHVHFFRPLTQTYSDVYANFGGYGWFDPGGSAGVGGPNCNVAESFFIRNPGPSTNWIRNFTVQFAGMAPPIGGSKSLTSPPAISRILVSDGKVTLTVASPNLAPYDVQFSTNRQDWSTIAVGQSKGTWTADLPTGPSGYFQVVASKAVRRTR